MIKSSAVKTAVLVLLLMVFSGGAVYADTFPNFFLRIEDATAGVSLGVVIGDNTPGDQDPTNGNIVFNGFIGGFFGGITIARSQPQTPAGDTILTLSSTMGRFAGAGQGGTKLVITLEDMGYSFPDPQATFTGTLSGVNIGSNGAGNFQTWLNINNQEPALGSPTFPAGSLPAIGPIPQPGSAALFQGAGVNNVTGTPATYFETGSFNSPVGSYSLFSQAVINFDPTTGGGSANFTLQSKVGKFTGGRPLFPVNVPEPTSLLLLGSGLVTLGLLRKKKSAA